MKNAGSASWPLVLSVAMISGGAGYLLAPRDVSASASASTTMDKPQEIGTKGKVSSALAQLDEISTENKNLKKQIGELVTKLEKTAGQARLNEEALKTAQADLAVAKQVPLAPKVENPKSSPAPIASGKWQAALDKVDWDETGKALREMLPLLTEYAYSMRDGKPMPESVGRLSKWNGSLVDAALKLQGAGIPGSGVNGAYTHYVAVVNQMAMFLSAVGLPLSEAQSKSFGIIAVDYDNRDERRRAAEPSGSLALASMLGESRLKGAFYGALRQELDPPQRQALVPEDLRDRVGVDLFSPGLIWAASFKPLKCASKEEFVRAVKGELERELELGADAVGAVGAAVEDWGAGLPDDFFTKSDRLEQKGMLKLSRIHIAAEAQVALNEKLLSGGNLTPEQKALLTKVAHAWVPLVS